MELESAEEVAVLLGEVLTPSELHDVELRWEIMEMLAAGTPQRQIAAKLGVSLCKITRGAKYLKSGGSVVTRLAGKERGRE